MKTKDIKAINIQAREWFDRLNGNSYFSAIVEVYNRKNEKTVLKVPFQYGYGSHFEYVALDTIKEFLNCFKKSGFSGLGRLCRENNIILISNKNENCTKTELKELLN